MFIIIGIILLFVTALIILLVKSSSIEELPTDVQFNIDSVELFVSSCLEKSLTESTSIVLNNGGYTTIGSSLAGFTYNEGSDKLIVPFYLHKSNKMFPSLSTFSESISSISETKFLECINNFKSFEKEGYKFNIGVPLIRSEFTNTKLMTHLTFPFKVSLGSKNAERRVFETSIPLKFIGPYAKVNSFIKTQSMKEELLLSSLSESLSYEGIQVQFQNYGINGENILFEIILNEDNGQNPFIWNFALGFDWTFDEEKVIEIPPVKDILFYEFFGLNEIPTWKISTHGIKILKVPSFGEGLQFELDTDTFSIDSSGVISLDPVKLGNDEYLHYVKVIDPFGNEKVAPLRISINIEDELSPKMNKIEKQVAHVGTNFSLKVNAERALSFSSGTYLFEINNKTGEMYFTPSPENVGIHYIRVDAINNYGSTWQRWELEVK